MEISVVIPVFNEAKQIEVTLLELEAYMKGLLASNDWEIIVVNDGSSDETLEVLNRLSQKKNWLRVVDLKARFGRGRALRAGFEESRGRLIVSLDADLSYAPNHIERMVDKMEKENADIVLASAYRKGGRVKNVPWPRLWVSRLGNKILAYMFSGQVTVLTCMVRAYRSEFIKRLDLNCNDKDIHLEILYKARLLGGKIVEVPADLCWRKERFFKGRSLNNIKRRSTASFKKTSSSHLFFALLNKPGLIFWVPGYFLLLVSISIFIVTAKIIFSDMAGGTSLYFALRNSMIQATPSWITMVISFILGIQFFTLGFLTNQNKSNYEEIYKTLHSIFAEVKKQG